MTRKAHRKMMRAKRAERHAKKEIRKKREQLKIYSANEPLSKVDHSKIIDGFNELRLHNHYLPFDTYCGICGVDFHVTSAAQKCILEENRIPVKMLMRGAIFCVPCRKRRSRINYLRKKDRWKDLENGREELRKLEEEELELKLHSGRKNETAFWPY